MRESESVLEVKDLRVNFHTYRGEVKALNGVDLELFKREILGLVGESGCGKSVTALTILGLLPENAYVIGGEIIFKGNNLLEESREAMNIHRDSLSSNGSRWFTVPASATRLSPHMLVLLSLELRCQSTVRIPNAGGSQCASVAIGSYRVQSGTDTLGFMLSING